VVVLNEHGGHGGSDAAPTAMAVIQKYFDLKREDQTASREAPTQPAAEPEGESGPAGGALPAAPEEAPKPGPSDTVPGPPGVPSAVGQSLAQSPGGGT
jgi:hypothetical protein